MSFYFRIILATLLIVILSMLAIGLYVTSRGFRPLNTLNILLKNLQKESLEIRLQEKDWPQQSSYLL